MNDGDTPEDAAAAAAAANNNSNNNSDKGSLLRESAVLLVEEEVVEESTPATAVEEDIAVRNTTIIATDKNNDNDDNSNNNNKGVIGTDNTVNNNSPSNTAEAEAEETSLETGVEPAAEATAAEATTAAATETITTTTTTTPTRNKRQRNNNKTFPQQKQQPKQRGSKKGGKREDRPQSYWYRLCQLFETGDYKSQIHFLRSADSGTEVGESHAMHFSRAFKKYKNGTLGNIQETRARKRKYEPLEQRIIQYVLEQEEEEEEETTLDEAQQQQQQFMYDPGFALLATGNTDNAATTTTTATRPRKKRKSNTTTNNQKKGKSPLAWSILQAKAKEWAQELGLDDGFQASAGWIDSVLKRHQRQLDAQQQLATNETTLTQRRDQAQTSQKWDMLMTNLQHANQTALIHSKGLQVGDRVTVMGVSQQNTFGDLIITQLSNGVFSSSDTASAGENNNNNKEAAAATSFVTVQRKHHGSTQNTNIDDVRKVLLHSPQEEDTATLQRLLVLLPREDTYLAHWAHFPRTTPRASRVLRPIWELPPQQQHQVPPINITTASMRLEYSQNSCAEKINIHMLKHHLLPAFRKDHKERAKLVEELQSMSHRNPMQQTTLETLHYVQTIHELLKDLYEMVKDFPARGRTVVYQVDYQALDVSMRGRLMAQNPMSLSSDSKPSYSPRTLTLQAMPADVRTALVGSFAHFITTASTTTATATDNNYNNLQDDNDRRVRILCSLANMCHASDLIPTWLEYQMHSSAWYDYIQIVHNGISRDQAKALPMVLLQGGTYDTWKQAMLEQTAMSLPAASDDSWINLQAFVFHLATEWRALRDIVLTLPQFVWTELDRQSLLSHHDVAPAVIPNVLMVRVLQACEQEIWNTVERTFMAEGWKIRAKLLEGILVEGPTPADAVAPVLAAAQHACQMRGYNVALAEGHCFGMYTGRNQKDSLPLLQRARDAMEQLEQQQQEETVTINPTNEHDGSVNANNNNNATVLDPAAANGELPLFEQI